MTDTEIAGYPVSSDVTLLKGSWPEWYGNIGMKFIYIRIRYGTVSIGIGGSHVHAMNQSRVVREDPTCAGVTDMQDAIRELERAGYKVRSIVVPEHVEELK